MKMAGAARSSVRAIGAHGQTVRHRPQLGFSVQLNAPALLAELTQIDVVADFRSRDIAAGGHGAPLASLFHIAAFSGPQPRAAVNIGGISNLTGLPKAGDDEPVIGFDTGPGNLLLDYWVQKYFAQPFDRNGALAASAGAPINTARHVARRTVFCHIAAEEQRTRTVFARLARARDGKPNRNRRPCSRIDAADRCCIGRAVSTCTAAADVVVCGGGARMRRWPHARNRMRATTGLASSALGVEPDQVEALAFAWLAHAHVSGQAGNVPSVTGARGGRILGALYPAQVSSK